MLDLITLVLFGLACVYFGIIPSIIGLFVIAILLG